MDWQLTWHILQGAFALGALVLAAASLAFAWSLRGIINWRRSIRSELQSLKKGLEAATGTRRHALEVVLSRCQGVWGAAFPQLRALTDLPGYIRSIGACYHPGVERPELRITAGRFLKSARGSVDQLELILRRPGFRRLRRVRIRHIRQAWEWYEQVRQYWIVRYFNRNWAVIRGILRLRLVILPDPLPWLAYLSNRLTMLTLTRLLLVDCYLAVGRLAIQAYDEQGEGNRGPTEMDELESTLGCLRPLRSSEPDDLGPEIRQIRNRLVGLTATLVSTPGLEEWKEAVRQAATVIARRHFPHAGRPLEEAALGPLANRTQVWLKSVCDTEKIPVVKRLHSIRIGCLYHVKSLTGSLLGKQALSLAKTTWDVYRQMRWTLRVYRSVKKTSPAGIAMDVGWMVCKRGFTNFILRYTFDLAWRELEMIYSQSRAEKAR